MNMALVRSFQSSLQDDVVVYWRIKKIEKKRNKEHKKGKNYFLRIEATKED